MLIRIFFILKESLSDLKFLLPIIVLSGFLLFSSMGLLKKIYSGSHEFFGLNKYTVYFVSGTSEDKIAHYIEAAKKNTNISSVEFFPSKKVKDKIAKSFPEIAIELNSIQMDDFPSYADIAFHSGRIDRQEEQLKMMRQNPIVNQLVGYREYTEQVELLLKYIKYIAYGISGVFLLVFCLGTLIFIQRSIYRNFDEIYVMKILGASNSYTIKPYLIYAVVFCSILFGVSYFLSLTALVFLNSFFTRAPLIHELTYFLRVTDPTEIFLFYSAAILVSIIGSKLTAKQAIKQITHITL